MCKILINNLSSTGLILDIIGVLLLWKFGLPNKPLPSKDMLDVGWVDEVPEKDKVKHKRDRLIRVLVDHLAYILLLFGFLAQLVSNYIKIT